VTLNKTPQTGKEAVRTPPFPPSVAVGAVCRVTMTKAQYPNAHRVTLAERDGRTVRVTKQEPVWYSGGFYWIYHAAFLDSPRDGLKVPREGSVEAFCVDDLILLEDV
jgi:hypothetical protein